VKPRLRPGPAGVTLVELLVVVALLVIIIAVTAPSFRQMIDKQRVVNLNAQVVTDMQFARSEAATRRTKIRVAFQNDATMTCYSIFTYSNDGLQCNCLLASPCNGLPAGYTEIKTVRIPKDGTKLRVYPDVAVNKNNASEFAFEPLAGGLYTIPLDFAWEPLDMFKIRTWAGTDLEVDIVIGQSGRPTLCAPASSKIKEAAC